jgi:hypothetical protein
MNVRVVIVALAVPLVALAVSAGAQPATHSPLDPVRFAADFAPGAPTPPAVRPFEAPSPEGRPAPVDSVATPSDPPAPAMPPLARPGSIVADEQPSVVGPVIGALVGGAAGFFGGAALGLALLGGDEYSSDEYEDVAAVLIGATVGEVLLMPAGAHFANGSRGSYGAALGGSALGFAGGIALSALGPVGAVIGVALQTTLTVAAERRSAARRALPAPAASVTLP